MIVRLRIFGVLVVVVALAALLDAPIGSAGAGVVPDRASKAMRVGVAPRADQNAQPLSPLPGQAKLRIDVALQPRDPPALTAYATSVSSPRSSLYHHYLTTGQFVSEFGPSAQSVSAVDRALRAAGLHPGGISRNHLSIPVRATAQQLSSAFSTSFEQYRVAGGRIAYANTAAPLIASSAAPYVQSVVGLDNLSLPQPADSTSVRAFTRLTHAGSRKIDPAAGGPQPCSTAVNDASAEGGVTLDQLATAYGFSGPYSSGDLGAGQTVAVFELAGYSASDVSAFQSCYGTHTSITTVNVDGGPGVTKGSGFGEADGDIEIILSLAPDVSIVDYQAPDTGTGSYDNYNAVISQDAAKVISTSWLLCEQYSSVSAENTLFEEAATQGQTVLAATGDYGSEGCVQADKTNTSLAVDDPASQPFVTGVGGTTVSSIGPPPSETVWNDGADTFGSGGGGISADWSMPSYQSAASAGLGVINAYSSGAPCGSGYCREVPDVSADAGGGSSWYVLYIDGGWATWGGTSFATPLWAALIALSNASMACSGETVGFANPALYSVASSEYSTAFNDITVGNNDYTQTNGGLYPALDGYDMATGLGTPNANVLPGALCADGTADPVTVTNPGPQSTYSGQSVSLQIGATDTTVGQTLSYSTIGLPAGLSINASSGLISGVPTASGLFSVVVTAEDSNGASDSATFAWSVPSSITKLSPLYGTPTGGTKVSISGTGFTGTTEVQFGSSPATKVSVNKSGTKITAHSPSGSGLVEVVVIGPGGTSKGSAFDYGPSITKLVPASGPIGAKVTIDGTNLSSASRVTFSNGVAALIISDSAKKITVDVPSGAVSGRVSVTTAGGSATSSTSFSVT